MHTWSLSTKFKNKRKNNTIPGKTKVYILGEDKLRMDVYDPFGFVSMGQLILNGGYMSVKTINGIDYKGPASKDKVREFLRVEVLPSDLFALFSQKGLSDRHWSCTVGNSLNKYQFCQSDFYQIDLSWSGSMTQKGTNFILRHAKADLKFKVKSYRSTPDPKESIFTL